MGHLAHFKKIAAGIAVVGALTAITITPAFAADTTPVEIGITGTPRTVEIGALTFEDAALDFSLTQQTVTTVGAAGVPALLTVTDMSGTGTAWTVYAESTALISGSDSIPNSAIVVTPGSLVTADAATLGAGGDLSAQRTVMSAATDAGDGPHTAELDVTITVPGSQHVGTYSGTLTVTETVNL